MQPDILTQKEAKGPNVSVRAFGSALIMISAMLCGVFMPFIRLLSHGMNAVHATLYFCFDFDFAYFCIVFSLKAAPS